MAKNIENELKIENRIRELIKNNIIGSKNEFTLLDNKDITDIIICRNMDNPKIFFIEVKHYSPTKRLGGVGFGNDDGSGFQPEILIKRPKYFENNLIWIFCQENDNNYYVLNNEECLLFIMGGEIGIKQNNFQRKLFVNVKPFNEMELINWLKKWLQN